MKNSLAACLLAIATLLSLMPSMAHAQYLPLDTGFSEYGCSVRLEMPNGKVKKTYLERKSALILAKSLNLYFTGGVYDGETPIYAAFKIEDRDDKSKSEILTSEITRDWHWKFERRTKVGHLTVTCE